MMNCLTSEEIATRLTLTTGGDECCGRGMMVFDLWESYGGPNPKDIKWKIFVKEAQDTIYGKSSQKKGLTNDPR